MTRRLTASRDLTARGLVALFIAGSALVGAIWPAGAQVLPLQAPILVEARTDPGALAAARISTSDTTSLLDGIDIAGGGAISGIPVIHGLGDDRIRTLVNGVPIAAACPMHMNPPLSYLDPSKVARVEVLPGVTPVSLGGDSIGGTIVVESAPSVFAATDQSILREGSFSSFYRSNSAAAGIGATFQVASSDLSLRYEGSASRAADYQDGDGDVIRASRIETSNQQLTAAYRNGQDLFEARLAFQQMPYEGFPNADMDLAGNTGAFLNARYEGSRAWGLLAFRLYYDHIDHQMNGNAPDRFAVAPVDITSMGNMPTRERSQDYGYRVQTDIAATSVDTLRVGNELHVQTLDDRWPGAPVDMMFDYVNVNHAARTQLGTFVEWERSWAHPWSTLVGVRNDTIWMNTGPVQGYDGIDASAQAFNATGLAHTDVNIDATLLTRYQPDEQQTYSVGFARKNRSPNFYERYAWGTNTMGMISWFGDGNGYTGKVDLKPETANTWSLSADWHDPAGRVWELKMSPYFTVVQHYISVVALCDPACSGSPASQLQFANQQAHLYGVDLAFTYVLSDTTGTGTFRLASNGRVTRGEDLSTHTNLYHLMPLNGSIALEHQRGRWSSALEIRAADGKTEVDAIRLEPKTPGYAIANLRTAFDWQAVRLDLAITNLFNHQYELPLGGTWQSALYAPGYAQATFHALPAPGRSLNAGLTVNF